MGELVIYQPDDGSKVSVRLEGNTIWLTQRQLSDMLETSTDNIGLHLKNIYASGELVETATTEDFSVVQQEGQRPVSRRTKHYNLDAIISVGYRVNSKRGTQFRQWATGVLRDHLMQGWTLDRARFQHNAAELEAALTLVRKTAQSPDMIADTGRGLVEIVSRYTQTFLLLQRYDEGLLTEPNGTEGGVMPSLDEARQSIASLKADLMFRGEASNLFGLERGDALAAILGNLDQSIFGEPAYPTIEGKAAHLLYFIIKNHPFADGNKRNGAFRFVDFLNRNNALMRDGQPVINDIGLAALALLVAESAPTQKSTMIRLIENMLASVR
ncbi:MULTISPECIES: RhuM family protein [unclassified Undibacterium]|uniref:RhuM family protein n=1 Tax=unclassified Undibacterium TaxID=2630295 RepID=UPI002AC99594|nr:MULTISPECIES: RhuM family protein [unclassified Undibacterium]MEB0139664.1 RhuM family protein [Undibacterium sp. CCC2.1]MEB0172545.1 RhuM family protein [Undibacterium sp. CCC1.1]MEB0176359.1 RhuM family protein [Undibacterium sp. CCC3.4]MEB0215693.1 RhuM family protein [Undibacterium sp. 5I2]WPX42970.1 RhuM family protein [Undibacterium sp. CCC3.4]